MVTIYKHYPVEQKNTKESLLVPNMLDSNSCSSLTKDYFLNQLKNSINYIFTIATECSVKYAFDSFHKLRESSFIYFSVNIVHI